MAITYEYKIANLEYTNDDKKAVLIAHYDVRASDPDLGEQTGFSTDINWPTKPE